MRKRSRLVSLVFVLLAIVACAGGEGVDPGEGEFTTQAYSTDIYKCEGGDKMVVADGGEVEYQSGGELEMLEGAILDIQAGVIITIAGDPVFDVTSFTVDADEEISLDAGDASHFNVSGSSEGSSPFPIKD